MRFSINREEFLKPLQLVASVIERRNTMPVLSNVLLDVGEKTLSLTGSDLEVELIGKASPLVVSETGVTTLSARKLMEICKSLPEDSEISMAQEGSKMILSSGSSRYTLSTLPAVDFPNIDNEEQASSFAIDQVALRHLIDKTGFAMAQQDVRYYLNGMLLEIRNHKLRAVATDGHRLAMCTLDADITREDRHQFIVPRKGILGLARLIALGGDDEPASLAFGKSHIRAYTGGFVFTSKLVDGKFPDYDRVIPKGGDKEVIADREVLKQALTRASILSNEKYRGVRLLLENNNLKILANNPEQEEAEENIDVDYMGEPIEIGFNVHYILNVLSAFTGDKVVITLSDSNSGALIEEPGNDESVYVIMPMRI